MNWWHKWKWFYKNTCNGFPSCKKEDCSAKWDIWAHKTTLYIGTKDGDKIVGEFNIRRNWIEKL